MTKIRGKDLPLAERSPWRNRMLAAETMLRVTREDMRVHLLATDSMSGKALASRIAEIDKVIGSDKRALPPTETHRHAVNEAGRAVGAGDEK